jgi:hypothetical protein
VGCGGKICRVIADTANQTQGDFVDSGRWQEIQVQILINFYFFRDFRDSDLREEEDFMSYILSTQSIT